MIDDNKLNIDESRRLQQHETVKGAVREDVHADIARNAAARPKDETAVEELAGGLRHKAIAEVADTESEIERARGVARISQVIDYLFGLIYGIIGLEIVLEMLGARDSSGFKRFLDMLAAPLLAPFRGLMPDPSIGHFHFMLSYIIGMVIYLLLHLAVNGLLRLMVHKKTVV
jgi:uncharacterized protein YggT (Ycf19 family)